MRASNTLETIPEGFPSLLKSQSLKIGLKVIWEEWKSGGAKADGRVLG